MTDSKAMDAVAYHSDISYCIHDGVELKGDWYLPNGPGPFPVLVAAPGGAWRVCSRASLRQWGMYLAARGYGIFAIDYRVSTPARKAFPEAVRDVIAAVRFVRGSADRYGVDPQRIALLGTSAGAHLAALAALAHDQADFGDAHRDDAFASVPAQVKAAVLVYGIYDVFKQWQADLALNPGVEGSVTRNLVGKEPYEDPQLFFDASPVKYVAYAKNRLPVLVSWGTADEFVSPEQSESFVRMLQQARFNVRTHRAIGASHFWFAQSPDDAGTDSAHLAPRLLMFLKSSL
jgi:acetyl esterase/lipase